MKTAKNIKLIFAVFVTAFAISQVSAQSLYEWKGGSGLWQNEKNWTVNDKPASHPPDKEDVVHIYSEQAIEIELDSSVEIAAIATTGSGKITLNTTNKIKLKLKNAALFSEHTRINENLMVINQNRSLYSTHFAKSQNDDGLNKNHVPIEKPTSNSVRSACSSFTIVPIPTGPTCNGGTDGIAAIEEPTDGVGPYVYQWVGGPNTTQWSNVGAGTYTIIVVDLGQGVQCNTDVFLNEPGPLTVLSMNGTPPLCSDACDGTAMPIVIGGNGGYSLSWSSGETGFSATGLCTTFDLNVIDFKGCTFDTTYTYTDAPDPIQIIGSVVDVACFGDNDGEIEITTTGGTGSFDYHWTGQNGFTSLNKNIQNLSPGDYTLNIIDANGCTADESFSVIENPLLEAVSNKVDNVCSGGSDAEISIIPSGGLPDYSFQWSGPNGFTSTSQNIENLESGVYEVTITDEALCTYTEQITIVEPSEININVTAVHIDCAGADNGEITVSASGGTPSYDYDWTGPNGFTATGPGISNLEPGSYQVVVTDHNLCTQNETIEITEPDEITATFTITEITCHDGNDGAVSMVVNGGTPNYTYQWSGPNGFSNSAKDISNLSFGSYSVTITDENDCEVIQTVEIENPLPIEITGTITDNTCAFSANGAIQIQVTGGEEPYFYTWTGPSGYNSNAQNLNNIFNGTYNLTVRDKNLCENTATFTVTVPDPVVATFDVQHASCYGVADGAIQITPTGGEGPYTFIWVGPAGFTSEDQNLTNIIGGSYSVQILDANNCMSFHSTTVNEPAKIKMTGPVTDVGCYGGADGTISPIVSGGSGGFTYEWVGPNGFTSTLKNITGLEAGEYTLVATDASGCDQSKEYTVNEPAEIAIDGDLTNVTCAGHADGSIELEIGNGNPPFDYNWTGPNGFTASTKDIQNLSGGSYTVQLIDADGCEQSETFQINEDIVITVQADVDHVSCFGYNDGKILVEVQGGGEPYQLNWTGPGGFTDSQTSIQNLVPGEYELTVLDGNGCESIHPITINEPQELTSTLAAQNISCFGNNDAGLTANIMGGTEPYEVSWTGPDGFSSTNETISNLVPGYYEIEISDKNGCEITDGITIIEPDELTLSVDVTQPGCLVDDGSLTANVTGGLVFGGYNYQWTDENDVEIGTGGSIQNLAPGNYSVLVMDDNGCEIGETVELFRATLEIEAEVVHVACYGQSTGSIEITPMIGSDPFVYSWSGPNGFSSTQAYLENLGAGTYELTIQDAANCEVIESYQIQEADEIIIVPSLSDESCPEENDGQITLSIQGGTPGYSTNWTGPNGFSQSGLNIDNLVPGIYSVQTQDVNGCLATASYEIHAAQEFDIQMAGSNPICAGETNGEAQALATSQSGTDVFTYQWTGPDGYNAIGASISNLDEGKYYVNITNQLGCTQIDSVEIVMPDSIFIDVDVVGAICQQQNGSASANVSGGVGQLTLTWYDGDDTQVATGSDITNVASGTYTLRVEDESGCIITQVITISDTSGSVEGEVTNPICEGGDDGAIQITVIGGTEPFDYEWSLNGTTFATTKNVEDLEAGTYVVIVTDADNCNYVASFVVDDTTDIEITPTVTDISCEPSSGKITLAIVNTDNPVVQWSGPSGFTDTGLEIVDLDAGIYNYEILTEENCIITGSVEVNTVDPILVTAQVKDILCGGESSGFIDISVIGGASPLNYEWTGPDGFTSANQDIADIPAGQYSVTVTDANNCYVIHDYTLTENDPISAQYDVINPDCNQDNGSIEVTLSGGVITTDYFVSWTDENGVSILGSAILTNLGVGVYHFTGMDDNGCSTDTVFVLSNPDADIEAVLTHISCPNADDGAIEMEINGVTEPYTVAWTGPSGYNSNQEEIDELAPGEYHYTVIGADLCEFMGSYTILPADELTVTAQITESCAEMTSGGITLSLSGVPEPYGFDWTGPDGFSSQNQDLSQVAAGDYQVEITYSNTCTQTLDFTIGEKPEIEVDIIQADISCFGEITGTIQASIQGGAPPYDFEWTGPNGFESDDLALNNLEAGVYVLVVTDDLGCSKEVEVEITEPQELVVEETLYAPGCSPVGNSMIEIEVSGGEPGYTVSWTGPNGFTSTNYVLIDIEPGTYHYTIEDSNGCSITGEMEMPEQNQMTMSAASQDISCYGKTDGKIEITISGGIEPVDVLWTGPDGFTAQGITIQGLDPGVYAVHITDAGGCTHSESIEIVEPQELEIHVLETNDASCSSSQDGTIDVEVMGGIAPYTYAWSNQEGFTSNSQNLQNLAVGEYSILVTDQNGCEEIAEVEISFMLEVTVDAGEDMMICHSDLPLHLVGEGVNVDEFTWYDTEGNTIDENLLEEHVEAGIYTLVLVGTNSLCSATDTLVVEVVPGPDVDAGVDQEVFQEEIFTLGGSPTSHSGVSYEWSPSAQGSFDSHVANPTGYLTQTTRFVVKVTDNNGCASTDSVWVVILPELGVYSGFSPNDDGVNDTWIIDNIELFPNNVVHIFNRWGQVLYEQKPYNNGNAWDGTFEGKKLPVGTYYYTIDLKDERFPEKLTGPITIYR